MQLAQPCVDASGRDAVETVQDWVHHMEVAALSPRTISERTRVVAAVSRGTGLSPLRLTSAVISGWLRDVAQPTSRATYFQVLVAWHRFLVRVRVRDDDPMLRVPRPKVARALPRPADSSHIDAVLRHGGLHPDTRAKILLGCYAGLRVHEIAKVDGADFRVTPGLVRVKGKGARTDMLPVHALLAEEAERRPARGPWFPSPADASRPVLSTSVSSVISHAFARAGSSSTAHQLRHWFATTLLEEGVDVRVVQELMRHSSLATTAIYTRVSPQQRRVAVEALPKLGAALLPSPMNSWRTR